MTSPKEDRIRAASRLAEQWKKRDPKSKAYLFIPEAVEGPIRLLHVTKNTPATGSVEAFGFRPTRGVAFSTHIAEVTPDEFEKIKTKTIKLPDGWPPDDYEELPADAPE